MRLLNSAYAAAKAIFQKLNILWYITPLGDLCVSMRRGKAVRKMGIFGASLGY
jgi:hypothetical protein